MAFGGRELRLLLSIQSYGTTNISRLRRDILSLGAATRVANANQLAVQSQLVKQAEKLTRINDRIATMEQATIAKRLAAQTRAEKQMDRLAARRVRAERAMGALPLTVAAKRLQIARSLDKHAVMQGSQAANFAKRDAALATQRMRIENQIANSGIRRLAVDASILNNKATLISRERQLVKVAKEDAAAIMSGEKSLRGYGPRIREATYRYRAAQKSAERLAAIHKQLPREVAILEAQLNGVQKQEALISAQKTEQAAAVARQVELLTLQNAQLNAIEEKEAEIAAAIALISREEALVDNELKQQLASLEAQSVVMQRLKVLAGEIAAEMNVAATRGLATAASMDSLMSKQRQVMQREAKARTIQHAGRTAQFAGLIGTAIAATSASAFANFNEQVMLAATQTRQFDEGAKEVARNADLMVNGVDKGAGAFEGILDMMQKFPATGDEMASAAYDIFSSMQSASGGVLSLSEGMKLLQKFNQLAVATGTDLETTTNAGITVMNNFGKATMDTDKALNLMVATVRFGRMRLSDFNAMLEKVAPAAAASGQQLEDVAGAMALITTRQPSQRVSATGIARLLQTFRDPEFQKGAFRFGADITRGAEATGKLKPLPKIIDEMAHSFGLFEKQGGPQQLFKDLTALGRGRGIGRQSRIEAANAFTFLIANIDDYRALQAATTKDADEFAVALANMSDAPGVKWKIFINQMRAFVLIIGQAALPALLQVTEKVVELVQWFGQLDRHTREMIVKWGVILSVGALVVGTLVNIGAGLVALSANFKIMRIEAQLSALAMQEGMAGAAAQASLLSRVLTGLMGIGIIAIPIVLQAIKGGDPSVWQLLGSAVSGAIGGFMVGGPAGAAIGAITVPAIVQIQAERQKGGISKAQSRLISEALGFDVGKKLDPEEFGALQDLKKTMPHLWGILQRDLAALNEKGNDKQLDIMKAYRDAVHKFNKETFGTQAEALRKAAEAQDNQANDALAKAKKLADSRADAVAQAMQNMNQKIESAVSNLASIYDKFEEINKSAFATFEGPTMQGFLGDIFSNINDLLRQFGEQIPVPFSILRQDLDQQMTFFERWRGGLDKLLGRGVPIEMVQEIQKLGPNAIPMIEGLLGASPSQLKGYVTDWKKAQIQIQEASKADMDRQLADWMKHGKDIAFALITGLASSPAQAKLRAGFKTFVTKTFGGILREQMAVEIAAAMKKAAEDIKRDETFAPKDTTPTLTLTPQQRQAVRDARLHRLPPHRLSMAQIGRQITVGQRRIAGMREGGVTEAEARRIQQEQRRIRRLRRERAARRAALEPGHRDDPRDRRTVTINEGDKVTIHADGANPTKVQQAINKRAFQRKNKTRH